MLLAFCLLLPTVSTSVNAQSIAVEGAARISHPLPGGILSMRNSTIYFTPGGMRFDEWRITLGVAPSATGLHDSGIVKLDGNPHEYFFGAVPYDGNPILMRFSQRQKGREWVSFEVLYNTTAGSQSAPQTQTAIQDKSAPVVQSAPEAPAANSPGYAIPAIADVQPVSGGIAKALKAEHRNGQTFITWTEVSGDAGYHVYRHTSRITASNLASAERLTSKWGPLDSNTSINRHATSSIPPTYVIENLQAPLSPANGLFVHTSTGAETAYYAVTTAVNGREQKDILAGVNSLVDGVVEAVNRPQPVLAMSLNRGKGKVYTQYMDYANWNPTFNGYAYNYMVTLPKNFRPSQTYPLLINPHAYGGEITVRGDNEYNWDVIQLIPQDPGARQGAVHSWWYGYAAEHNYLTDGLVPVAGHVENYTEQRVMMAIQHTLASNDFKIDPLSISAYGHSMGGSGSLTLGMRYGNVIAGIYGNEPMTNYVTSPVFQPEFERLWGSQVSNLPIINRGPYSENLTKYNGVGVWDWMDHHTQLVQRRGEKMAYLMVSHGKADDIIDWNTQGKPFARVLNDAKVGFSARSLTGAGHAWLGFAAVVHPLFGFGYDKQFPWRYPRNLSFLSVQRASGSGALEPTLDIDDNYNMDIEWATPQTPFAKSIVDKPKRYEVNIRSTSDEQVADITPRNTQQFSVSAGDQCQWQAIDNNNGQGVGGGVVTADSYALLTVPSVIIMTFKGTRLVIVCR